MTPVAPTVGEELADYRLEEILGRGAIRVVYRAEHPTLGSAVALKVRARPRHRRAVPAEVLA